MIHAARRNKWFSAWGWFATALALAIVCLSARDVPLLWVAVIFVAVTIVLGVSDGLNGLAFTDMLGRVLPEQRRSLAAVHAIRRRRADGRAGGAVVAELHR